MEKKKNVAQKEIDTIIDLDAKLDFVVKKWGQDIEELVKNPLIKKNSKKYDAEIKKINAKYKDLVSDILMVREELFHIGAKKQEEEYFSQFKDKAPEIKKTDEYGRPIGKKWVNGKWVDVDVKNW